MQNERIKKEAMDKDIDGEDDDDSVRKEIINYRITITLIGDAARFYHFLGYLWFFNFK